MLQQLYYLLFHPAVMSLLLTLIYCAG